MNHTHPHLSFDGFGINGRDKFRTRLATLRDSAEAQALGPVFAAAPDLLDFAREILAAFNEHEKGDLNDIPASWVIERATELIARATTPTP